MLKRTIKYTAYDGKEYEEHFYFNMNKAELLELSVSVEGGYASMIQQVVDTNDVRGYLAIVKDLIDHAYGKKTPDGKRFVKRPEYLEELKSSEAYSELIVELADPENFLPFIKGVFPWTPEVEAAFQKQVAELPAGITMTNQ